MRGKKTGPPFKRVEKKQKKKKKKKKKKVKKREKIKRSGRQLDAQDGRLGKRTLGRTG